jgi:BioD-like phosphotransacetylase family protein
VAVASRDDGVGLDAAVSAVRSLEGISEHVVAEVPNPATGSGLASPILAGLVARLAARVVAVVRYRSDLTAVGVASDVATLVPSLAGVVINQVPRYRIRHAALLLEATASAGIPVLGQLHEDREMLSVTMRQLAQQLGGRWELEPSDGGQWVDRFLIGGNIMDSGEGYFGRHQHQAVITRAERPDIQMASLMQDTQCLVLTGGSRPTEYIRVEAAKRSVPILLVEQNTVATADAVGGLMDAIVPHALHKAERMADLLDGQVDLDALLA